jgi:hypothetical protein
MQLRQAQRKQAKLRIGLFGPSGAGKTMSSLKLAFGITGDWTKVAIIDTENGSADLYSQLGDYQVLTIKAPYAPEKYIEAIDACERAGMEAIVVDSITHEWSGVGGILEIADELSKASKNSFTVWAKLTPRHNKFIDRILQSSAHVICCGRSKQEYVLNQVEKSGRTVNVPEKVGMKAMTRDGFDYEMTISFDIAINHYATTSKDRTGQFMDKPEFIISEQTGTEIITWNQSGAVPEVDPDEQRREIKRQVIRIGLQTEDGMQMMNDIIDLIGITPKPENFAEVIEKLKTVKPFSEELPKTASATPATTPPDEPKQHQEEKKEPVLATAPKLTIMRAMARSKAQIEDDAGLLSWAWATMDLVIESMDKMTMDECDAINSLLMMMKTPEPTPEPKKQPITNNENAQ